MNNTPAVIVNIQRQPGANVIEFADRIKNCCRSLRARCRSSIHVTVLTDRTITIRGSVKDVQFELMLAVALVVMVIFLFLRTLAATVIPAAAVPLSLVGSFGAMYLLGFSLNNLTLMALTISTGFVVDDAIADRTSHATSKGDTPHSAASKAPADGFPSVLDVSLIAYDSTVFMGEWGTTGPELRSARHHHPLSLSCR